MALILSGSIDARVSTIKPQFVGSASYAATASYALNAGGATFDTSSLITTASVSTNVVTFTKGDASTFDITVQTGSIPAGTVSSSAQTIANLPAGTVSGSAQTIANLPAGTVSGSDQLPSGIVSSSAQTIANLSGTDIISSSAQLPAGVVSGSNQIAFITASSIVNAETSSTSPANGLVFTKGDGTTVSLLQDTSSYVKTVNGVNPNASTGNVAVAIGSVETGTSASMLAASSSGLLDDADIWIIAGESGSLSGSNGEAYIFSTASGLLYEITTPTQVENDTRYVLKVGDTMTGALVLSQDPSNALGAATKQYVDPAFHTASIVSSSLGVNTITLTRKDTNTETLVFDSSSFAISASHAAYSILADDAQDIIVNVRNTSGGTLAKGTPVYGTGATGDNINVSAASASNAATMPAIGLLTTDLANNTNGNVILAGKLIGIDTSDFTAGDNVYVAPTGGLSPVRPVGDGSLNLVQNMAIVGKSNASEGEVVVIGSGRSNDVPNILSGSAWVGSSNGVATAVPTASFLVDTASYAVSASHAINVPVTSSYALTALTASYVTSSNVNGPHGADSVVTSSHAEFAISSSKVDRFNALSDLTEHPDDDDAADAGVPIGGLYRNGNFVLIRVGGTGTDTHYLTGWSNSNYIDFGAGLSGLLNSGGPWSFGFRSVGILPDSTDNLAMLARTNGIVFFQHQNASTWNLGTGDQGGSTGSSGWGIPPTETTVAHWLFTSDGSGDIRGYYNASTNVSSTVNFNSLPATPTGNITFGNSLDAGVEPWASSVGVSALYFANTLLPNTIIDTAAANYGIITSDPNYGDVDCFLTVNGSTVTDQKGNFGSAAIQGTLTFTSK